MDRVIAFPFTPLCSTFNSFETHWGNHTATVITWAPDRPLHTMYTNIDHVELRLCNTHIAFDVNISVVVAHVVWNASLGVPVVLQFHPVGRSIRKMLWKMVKIHDKGQLRLLRRKATTIWRRTYFAGKRAHQLLYPSRSIRPTLSCSQSETAILLRYPVNVKISSVVTSSSKQTVVRFSRITPKPAYFPIFFLELKRVKAGIIEWLKQYKSATEASG